MATPQHELIPPASMETPMFDSLEEERAYYARQADTYKNRLNQQVSDLKADTAATVRKGVRWGGAYLACYGLMRAFSGSKKHIVDTPKGPVRLTERESVLWTAVKGAALLGLGVVAQKAAQAYIARSQATHDQEPGLDPDTPEL